MKNFFQFIVSICIGILLFNLYIKFLNMINLANDINILSTDVLLITFSVLISCFMLLLFIDIILPGKLNLLLQKVGDLFIKTIKFLYTSIKSFLRIKR